MLLISVHRQQDTAPGHEATKPADRPRNKYHEAGRFRACTGFWHSREAVHTRGELRSRVGASRVTGVAWVSWQPRPCS